MRLLHILLTTLLLNISVCFGAPEHTSYKPGDNYREDIKVLKRISLITEASEYALEKQWQQWKRIKLEASVCYNCGGHENKTYHTERDELLKKIVKEAFNIYWNKRKENEQLAKKAKKAQAQRQQQERAKETIRIKKEREQLLYIKL